MIDSLSYGDDTSVFDPPAPDVFNNSGQSLQRQIYSAANAFVDTDTNADWAGSEDNAGTPCDTSPTAVSLQSFTANSNMLPILLIATLLVLLLGSTAIIWQHKRR